MAKDNREARKKPKEHKELDSLTPFAYKDLGSENDPCFGKLYSIKAKECKLCGDCEACAVVTSQTGFIEQITKQNSKAPFLDIQEGELVDSQNEDMRKYFERRTKKFPKKEFSVKKAIEKFTEKFNLIEADHEYVRQRIIMAIGKSKTVKLTENKRKYHAAD